MGKPNVGKSTLYNLLYGKERVVTASLAGTTRDSVMSEINHKKYIFELIDTAGLRKKGKVNQNIENTLHFHNKPSLLSYNQIFYHHMPLYLHSIFTH